MSINSLSIWIYQQLVMATLLSTIDLNLTVEYIVACHIHNAKHCLCFITVYSMSIVVAKVTVECLKNNNRNLHMFLNYILILGYVMRLFQGLPGSFLM